MLETLAKKIVNVRTASVCFVIFILDNHFAISCRSITVLDSDSRETNKYGNFLFLLQYDTEHHLQTLSPK